MNFAPETSIDIASAVNRATAPAGEPKLKVEKLNFYYGDNHALKNINFEILEKRVTAMIGPSGCGKSTLLRIFNRMYQLYPGQRAEGKILFDGEDLLGKQLDSTVVRSRIGMVFQKPTRSRCRSTTTSPSA